MLQSIGVPGLVIILVIALILFGPSKLPQLGKAVGQTLKEFKDSTKDVVDDVTGEFKEVKEEFKLVDNKKVDTEKNNSSSNTLWNLSPIDTSDTF